MEVYVLLRYHLHTPTPGVVLGVFATLKHAVAEYPQLGWEQNSQGRWKLEAEPFGYVVEAHEVQGLDTTLG